MKRNIQREKRTLYLELGFESLKDRIWVRNFETYLKSYLPSDLTIAMILYHFFKDLIEIRIPFTLYSSRQKLLKTLF